jgi:hypothetical protein
MKRVRIGLVVVASALAVGMMTAQGCGGTEEVADASADTSVPDTSVADTSVPKDAGKDTAPACDPNIDPFKNVQDASVGDSGLTTGLCAGCLKSKCKTEVDTCMKDCTCQEPIIAVLECVLKPGSGGVSQQTLLLCASGLATAPQSVQTNGLAIAGCIQDKCAAECVPTGLLDGGFDATRD